MNGQHATEDYIGLLTFQVELTARGPEMAQQHARKIGQAMNADAANDHADLVDVDVTLRDDGMCHRCAGRGELLHGIEGTPITCPTCDGTGVRE